MALSQYALSQLNVKWERDTKPSMFDFSAQSQTVPKKLSRQEVVEALKNVPDKNAGFDALLNAGYEIEWYEPQIQTLAPVKESTEWFIPTLKEWVRQFWDFWAAFGSTGVRAVTWIGSVLWDIISAPAYSDVELSWIFTGENADKWIGWFFRRWQDKIVWGWNRASWVDENSLGYKIGDFAWTAALTAPLWGLWLGSKIASAGTAGKIGYWALAWLGETAAQYTVSEWRLGTPTELAIGTGLWAWVWAIGAWISKFGNPVSSFFGKADDVVGKADDIATAKRAEELAKDIGARTQKGIVNNVEVDIPVQEWVMNKVVSIWDTDPVKLANKALTPSYAGKTPKQRVMNAEQVAERVKKLHWLVRQWKIEWDLSDLTTAARTVVNWLDYVGSDIGKMIDKAKWTLKLSDNILGTLDEAIESATAKRSPVTQILQNLKEDLGKDVSIVDAQAFKKIYQNEIGKFIKSWDAGTDQFKALVNATQELNDNIEKVVLKTAWKGLKEKKEIYGLFKSLADDITKSAQVEARSSPMPLVEQLGYLDALTDPKAFLKGQIGKELSEMNSRGGTWKRLINLYDKEAVKEFEKATKAPKNISTPKVPKGATEAKKAKKLKPDYVQK